MHPAEKASLNEAVAFGGGMKSAQADCAGRESWLHLLFSLTVLLWLPTGHPQTEAKVNEGHECNSRRAEAGSQRLTVGSAGAKKKKKSQHAEGDWASVDSSPQSAQSHLSPRNLKPGLRISQRVRLGDWKLL